MTVLTHQEAAAFLKVNEAPLRKLRRRGEIPASVEGDCIIAQAQLFDSPLAEKAWKALERGIFTHVCPMILRDNREPLGTGMLVEVSLATDDNPGCPGARILKHWECV